MTDNFRHLEFKAHFNSPADEVYRAFIHPTALRDWLCNAAQVDPHPGGRLYFAWEEGYYVNGAFTSLVPGKSIAFTWQGKDEPAATRVEVIVTPDSEQTSLILTHDEIPTNPEWDTTVAELKQGWESSLENLKSMLETGIDLREARRPLMGIFIGEFTPEIATKLGVPVKAGIHLQGAVDGSGAQAAGLQAGDVLVRLGGQELTDYGSLGPVIRKYKAGDEVEVAFYRRAELKTAPLKFSARVFPKLASRAPALAKAVKKDFRTLNIELAKRMKDCPEAVLEKRPAEGEWNIKETLAHLILCERDQQTWIADMLNDREIPESLEYSPNVFPRVQALVAVYPSRQQILTEFKRSQKESLSLLSSLPDKFVARKHIYNRLARWFLEAPEHHREHLAQMDAILATK
jgi:uncharacterized protein YndB with AHSA1/START domain